jgi:hypothetical protein
MHYFNDFLSRSRLGALCADALAAYDPARNGLDLSRSAAVDEIRLALETRIGRRLRYFGAFLLLVSETTIETAIGNAGEGWHTDGSCSAVRGDCFNAWIPLYNSSRHTGLEVIAADDNPWIYERLGDEGRPLEIYVRSSAADMFERIGADADLLLLRRDERRSLLLDWRDVRVTTCAGPAPGDLAIFRQTEIHRGFHQGGIRIQLSLKFLDQNAVDLRDTGAPPPPAKTLSKHGRLEAQLVRELLELQAAGVAALPRSSSASILAEAEA